MEEMHRRDFIRTATIATGAAAVTAAPALAQSPSSPPSSGQRGGTVTYTPKPLLFDPKTIKGMSEKLLVSHHDNNYAGAVKRLNAIGEQLAALDFNTAPVFVVNGLKREELIAANSMILHELFFDGLGGQGEPSGPLAEALAHDFGSIARWKQEFVATGKALGGGSGWVILTYSPRDKRLMNQWASDHTTNLAGGRPILAMDMYEHAYHMDYGAAAAKYVEAYMQVIKWPNAARLFAEAQRT